MQKLSCAVTGYQGTSSNGELRGRQVHTCLVISSAFMKTLIPTLFLLAVVWSSQSQVTTTDLDDVVRRTARILRAEYIDPDKGKAMDEFLMEQLKSASYKAISEPEAFTRKLTEDLRRISKDLHLSLFYSPGELPDLNGFETEINKEEKETILSELRKDHFGLERVEILTGNVGYLDFRFFAPLEFAGDTYAAAFKKLQGVEALIIDLRSNRGSMSDQTIPFLCGYLFSSSVHLNSIYFKKKGFTKQYWSNEYVPSKKLSDVPVYLLTSSMTFSGGEELAYDLKALKRATIIGHTTAGGANPVAPVKIHPNFGINLPQARVINPVTGTNWEGIGVVPDTLVMPFEALHTAIGLALRDMIGKSSPGEQEYLAKILDEHIRGKEQTKAHTFVLEGYTEAKEVNVPGTFNYWSRKENKMGRIRGGWTLTLRLPLGRHEYKFLVDGNWITDLRHKQESDTDGNQNSVLFLNN
jgi:hypothetical protein